MSVYRTAALAVAAVCDVERTIVVGRAGNIAGIIRHHPDYDTP